MGRNGIKLTDKNLKNSRSLVTPNSIISHNKQLAPNVSRCHIGFSFEYFKQIPYFQLGDEQNHWFVSLFDRLKDLSGKDSSILGDVNAKKRYRIHSIVWNQPNIPIKKSDLNWIPEGYLKNDEFEFIQFQLSKSNGRVVGFFNEDSSIFYIVLLDPKHNLQPSKDHNYAVNKTSECLTDYQNLLALLKHKKQCAHNASCPIPNESVEKYVRTSEQMVWIDEELLDVFMRYGVDDLKQEMEEFLLSKL